MTVKVAIDLALDRLFDYEVPEALQEKLAVGQLLSVPFGHREARGFAMAVSSVPVGDALRRVPQTATGDGPQRSAAPTKASRPFVLKPVTAIVDETPFFSPSLLTLVKKIAAYTAAPLESVLKAALPAAVLKKNVRPRELLYVEPTLTPFTDVKVTDHQQWLYEQIVRLGGGWMSSLCHELKTTSTALRALGAKGLLAIAVRERRRDPLGAKRILPTKPLALNAEQQAALVAIEGPSTDFTDSHGLKSGKNEACENPCNPWTKPILLHGVTGSGKTEVYLQAIAAELARGKGAIVMVPEIALTPQTVQRFASRFGNRVAVLHSALSDGERYDEWHRIRSGEARVVVGPRSAVFAPVRDLGIIIVDEEHEPSYKQEDNPRYHARDVAVLRGAIEGAKVVLGSATPSLESWRNAQEGKYALVTMAHRAGAGTLPVVRLVDMREMTRPVDRVYETTPSPVDAVYRPRPSAGIFSQALLDAIHLRLDRGEQTILFLNRRGYSRQVTCTKCGWVATCPRCDLPYTYHRADECLRCHICGGWIPTPKVCGGCGQASLTYQGIGTQRAEAALKKCFPKAAVLRMDADAVSRKDSHDDLLGIFRRGEADILVGTQMIAKGLDFPNVTLVGVLNADSSLNMPDFRAAERTFQLISQVAGRAGRAELPGEVIVQSYDPSAGPIQFAARGDFAAFAAAELASRRQAFFPPYSHLALVKLKSEDLKLVSGWSEMYAKSLARVKGLEVGEALPSVLEKADGFYRWQIVLRAKSAPEIVRAWRWISEARPAPGKLQVAIDIDAHNLV